MLAWQALHLLSYFPSTPPPLYFSYPEEKKPLVNFENQGYLLRAWFVPLA